MCAIIYSIINQKGSVGKTTTAINLAISLSIKNKKILLIDSDPQANITKLFNIDASKYNLSNIFLENVDIKKTIMNNVFNNIDLICSSFDLVKANLTLSKIQDGEVIFKKHIAKLRSDYDYIIIDCPSGVGFLNRNMIVASDKIIIPIRADSFALERVSELLSNIRYYQKKYSHSLRIDGFLLTMYSKNYSTSNELKKNIQLYYNYRLYKSIIPKYSKNISYQNNEINVQYHNKKNILSISYMKLANEILKSTNINKQVK